MPSRAASAALLLVLALALGLRLEGLDRRTLTHPECYVPGLDIRPPFDSPAPRRTLAETLQRTVDDDNHPPLQLVLMYAWTRAFGTDAFAVRLPSVAFGVLGVLAVWALARRSERPWTALLAALLLALNGLHVFWSQHARIWVLLALLAALATVALEDLLRRPTRRGALLYLAAAAAGLWTEYYFWIFFAAQIALAAARTAPSERPHAALRVQAAALLAASPLAVFLWSHARYRPHFIEPRTWPRLLEVLAGDGLLDLEQARAALGDAGGLAFGAGAVLGLAALVLGALRGVRAARLREPDAPDERDAARGLPLAGAAAGAALLLALHLARAVKPSWILAALPLPALGLGAWHALERVWPRLAPAAAVLARRSGVAALARDPAAGAFWLPLALYTGVALAKPLLVARGLLILAPAACVLLARAAASGAARGGTARALRAIGVVGLTALAASSARFGRVRANASADFACVGGAIAERAEPGEPVAVVNNWANQPVVLYLDQDRNRATTPERLVREIEEGAVYPRVWAAVLALEENLAGRLAEEDGRYGGVGYRRGVTVECFGGCAVEYVRE